MDKMPITRAGYDKLKKDLEYLRNVDLPENVRDIEVARAHGDLSENAEYKSAKERQAFIHARIKEVEQNLSACQVIEVKAAADGRAVFGCTVAIEDLRNGESTEYRLVGPFESDISENKISVTSPIGRALIGHKIGEQIRVQVPGGVREIEIADIFVEPED